MIGRSPLRHDVVNDDRAIRESPLQHVVENDDRAIRESPLRHDDLNDDRAIRESPLRRSIVSKAVGYLKMNSSKQIKEMYHISDIWQRNYHDHIIRNETEYLKIWQYIYENPYRWLEDCYYK